MSRLNTAEVDAFYVKARWRKGTWVRHTDDPELLGQIVQVGGQQWTTRDRPPMVRWMGKIDAVEVPLDKLVLR